MNAITPSSLQEISKAESKLCGQLYVVGFAVLLVVALIAQILGLKWRDWFPGMQSQKSLIGDVKQAVNSLLTCAFMQ